MFKIIAVSKDYIPISMPLPSFEIDLACNYAMDNSATHCLYLLQKVQQQMYEHIGWGETTYSNMVEQGGILLGNTYYDSEKEVTFGIVTEAIAAKLAVGNASYLEINHESWKQVLDEVDVILNVESTNNLQVIGWYHTHPNYLDVFMSGTDRATQSKMFNKDWQFAVVLNPHRKIWRAFFGEHSTECKAFFIKSISTIKKISDNESE